LDGRQPFGCPGGVWLWVRGDLVLQAGLCSGPREVFYMLPLLVSTKDAAVCRAVPLLGGVTGGGRTHHPDTNLCDALGNMTLGASPLSSAKGRLPNELSSKTAP
jgi:hypothetical protein